MASWYGYPYHGRHAANGEIYDMERFTAAHRTLPFGTWVEVLNLSNHKRVLVRINDRGPFVEGRIIDLSRAAARQIDMIGPGVVRVRLEVTGPPPGDSARELFAVQVGAFAGRSNAERLAQSLRKRYPSCRIVRRESSSPPWRVLVGSEATPEEAGELARQLRSELGAAFVVRLDDPPAGGL
ncbi:MAG: septal ring lytic transglycosylase RlpA family protein [Bryobacterales bacterium]|nr:septal ring lytic transglycosylase RlpA family protein [Bryobacterales bacterium]